MSGLHAHMHAHKHKHTVATPNPPGRDHETQPNPPVLHPIHRALEVQRVDLAFPNGEHHLPISSFGTEQARSFLCFVGGGWIVYHPLMTGVSLTPPFPRPPHRV